MTTSDNDRDRRLFAEELKAARAKRGWSSKEVADRIGFSQSTIKLIESAQRAPTPEQAERLDEVFQTPGTFQRIEGWIRGVPFSAGFRPFTPHEQKAVGIRTFEHSLVPGLFQTADYARAVHEVYPEATEDAIKEQVSARLSRQAILTRSDPPPPRVTALLAEHVLHADIGGPAVMAPQLKHLAELARMPRITIQIIPNKAHSGLLGAFIIADTGEKSDVVYLETALGGQVIESPNASETIAVLFDTLRAEALTRSDSLNMIMEAAQWWQDRMAP